MELWSHPVVLDKQNMAALRSIASYESYFALGSDWLLLHKICTPFSRLHNIPVGVD